MSERERLLIGVITYAGAKYCRDALFASIGDFTYPAFDLLIVTNSGEEDAQELRSRAAPLEARGCAVHVHTVAEQATTAEDQVVINRNALRDRFLAGDWPLCFSLDNDVLCPPDVIERLLATGKELVAGLYLMFVQRRKTEAVTVLPCAFVTLPDGTQCQASLIDVLQPRMIETDFVGLGCTLVPRKYLEKFSFRRRQGTDGGSTEDSQFFYDIRDRFGISPWLDTRIRCRHLKFPPGDQRNDLLDPDRYKIGIKKKE